MLADDWRVAGADSGGGVAVTGLLRLPQGPWTAPVVQALRAGAFLARADAAILELAGAGAVTCLQGLLTNDIEKPGDGAFVYGALLTPKGMMVVDGWAGRRDTTAWFTTPAMGRERALDIFTRTVPPRLARVADRTADLTVLRLGGPHALAIAEAARLPAPPAPGRVVAATIDEAPCEIARAPEGAPFVLQLVVPPNAVGRVAARLVTAGAVAAEPPALELARIVAGWPGLQAEIDDRTLPQEVRLDAIGGVSYTKGCYTGQETVSRLHFRGHANRELVGLEFDAEPGPLDPMPVLGAEREVGHVSSIAWLPDHGAAVASSGRWIGLGVLRRDAGPGSRVRAGGVGAKVVALPFTLPRWDPA